MPSFALCHWPFPMDNTTFVMIFGPIFCLGWLLIGIGLMGWYFHYRSFDAVAETQPEKPKKPKKLSRGEQLRQLNAEYDRQLAAGIVNPVLDLPAGMTMNQFLFPKLTLTERVKVFFGLDAFFLTTYGIENPRRAGEVYRHASWLAKQITEACRASHIHTPKQPDKLPRLFKFVPLCDLDDGTPQEETPFEFCLKPPSGVRISRFNDEFLKHLNSTLGGYKATMTFNGQGVWIIIPQYRVPARPPKCVLEDLGEPPVSYRLPLPLGMSNSGPYWVDLTKAPHVLFAGATGSGKSTLIHACLYYLLDRAEIWGLDLKMVELSRYHDQMARLVTDPNEVSQLLVDLFQLTRERLTEMQTVGQNEWRGKRVILVVDELAEVTLASRDDTQVLLRLAQIGRAAGVHLLLATQRPSVKIIPGDLKANIPLRIAMALPTGVDSRVVLDAEGAEELNPPGDALVLNGHKITRISTPNYKAPPPNLDIGDDTVDPRLIGLGGDARAVLVKMDGEKLTQRHIKSTMRWGSDRAMKALHELRIAGLLDAQEEAEAAAEKADVLEEAADMIEATPLSASSASSASAPPLSDDARAVLVTMPGEKLTKRSIMKRMRWGNDRALRVLRELREAGILGNNGTVSGTASGTDDRTA